MPRKKKILVVAGARPNFIKIAPLLEELSKHNKFRVLLVHTGQHYDFNMSRLFFEDLNIKKPDIYLGVGSVSQAAQIAKIMIAFEKVVLKYCPDHIIVVGDVNSTLACALVAAKLSISLSHVEAGLRSFDMSMPEEINRLVTDRLSDFLFTPSQDANINLLSEGLSEEKIFLVGNIMIDTLMKYRKKAKQAGILKSLGLKEKDYVVLTMHRPSNVDSLKTLRALIFSLKKVSQHIRIVFPIHPRTIKYLNRYGLYQKLKDLPGFHLIDPLGYLDFLGMVINAKFVITDSGGLQEETTYLGIPCLTIRENTERPITVELGTNMIVGSSSRRICANAMDILKNKYKCGRIPPLWDGKTSARIVKVIREKI